MTGQGLARRLRRPGAGAGNRLRRHPLPRFLIFAPELGDESGRALQYVLGLLQVVLQAHFSGARDFLKPSRCGGIGALITFIGGN